MAEVQEQAPQIVTMTINDLIYAQVKELGKRMDRLETRQDKLEEKLDMTRKELNARMDKQDEKIEKLNSKIDETRKELNARMDKQDEKIEKLADKIDALRNDMKFSSNHGNIMTATVIGIALGVLYSILK